MAIHYSIRRLIATQLAGANAPCVTTSFQAEGVVLLHLLQRVRPGIPVLFLDTFHHFDDVLDYRDQLAERWKLNLITLQADTPAVGLWQASTAACCAKHKVEPLFAALERYDLWLSGLRRQQSASRSALEEIDTFVLPTGKTIRKVSPLAHWSTKQVFDYANAHAIPLLPLYERGYTSIGCEPCTSVPVDVLNLRSGRWQGQKLECGIHVQVR
jgi:phosphoadenosine phosphosulfate reductase